MQQGTPILRQVERRRRFRQVVEPQVPVGKPVAEQVLTVIATIFMPLTFITSLYGMNFKNMPELQWEYGYYGVIGIIVVIALSMLEYFRRKQWL